MLRRFATGGQASLKGHASDTASPPSRASLLRRTVRTTQTVAGSRQKGLAQSAGLKILPRDGKGEVCESCIFQGK